MAPLNIPERYRAGVVALATMPEEAFSAFLLEIGKGLTADSASDLADRLGKACKALAEFTDLEQIIDATASLQAVFHDAHVSPGKFGKDVADAVSATVPALAKKIDPETLLQRIEKIAEAKRIGLTDERISSLRAEVEREFCCCRIITDVRAAFDDDASVPPSTMTILHTLRLGYLDDTAEHREFYVSLDNDDLSSLKEAIERALAKSKTLERLLAKADCRLYE